MFEFIQSTTAGIGSRLADWFTEVWAVVGDLYVATALGGILFGLAILLHEVRLSRGWRDRG